MFIWNTEIDEKVMQVIPEDKPQNLYVKMLLIKNWLYFINYRIVENDFFFFISHFDIEDVSSDSSVIYNLKYSKQNQRVFIIE